MLASLKWIQTSRASSQYFHASSSSLWDFSVLQILSSTVFGIYTICHYLGSEVIPGNMTPDGAGTINTASCTGNENRLIDCPRLTSVPSSCTHANDVGVYCRGQLFSLFCLLPVVFVFFFYP